jgi:ABC-2 type transport system ATP-binding protein
MTRVIRRMTVVMSGRDRPYLPSYPLLDYPPYDGKTAGWIPLRSVDDFQMESNMDAFIEAKDVVKRFRGSAEPALQNFNLSIPRGTLCGLVGPDGAGKTTALRILATVSNSFSGSASVAGYDVRTNPESVRSRIGYMPQNFSLYPDLSVEENLSFFADLNGVAGERLPERMRAMLEFTNLQGFRGRRAADLSGGMKKKLALACALAHDPQVLLLDEPSTGVDPVSRRELWRILADVVRRGVTVLVSTPYMDEAERCHLVGMMYQGRILLRGAPDELIGSMPSRFLEVKASPRKAMRQIVIDTPGILSWRPVGDRLRVETEDNHSTLERIREHLAGEFRARGMEIEILQEVRPMMEDLFVHTIGAQERAA